MISLLCVPEMGFSYHLDDHEVLTEMSFKLLKTCQHYSLPRMIQKEIMKANFNEDLNLLQKWLLYSHYYSSEKQINLWRYSADVRIKDLEAGILKEFSYTHPFWTIIYDNLGAAVHLVQDMSSPAHVIPISHDMSDEFESYVVNREKLWASLNASEACNLLQISGEMGLTDILREVALETKKAIQSPLSLLKNGMKMNSSWRLFWSPSPDGGFGEYGLFGNRFGDQSLFLELDKYMISPETYEDFKKTQMQLALRGTEQVYHWFLGYLKIHPDKFSLPQDYF